MTQHELEARLNAHREVIIAIMTVLMGDEKYQPLFDSLQDDTVFMDGEEDPGIVPSGAFASEAHGADEIRNMLDAAKARARHG